VSDVASGAVNTGLTPILEAAMSDLTSWVYDSHIASFLRPRQLTTHFHLDGPEGTGRAACVAMFKHLRHFGIAWDAEAVSDWAIRRGWVAKDVDLLREFAEGVHAGTRYHTVPQPWSRPIVESWLRGAPVIAAARLNRQVKYKSCCRKSTEPPPSKIDKMARYTVRPTCN
jgi:hypothetical protein